MTMRLLRVVLVGRLITTRLRIDVMRHPLATARIPDFWY